MQLSAYEDMTIETALYPEKGTGSLVAVNYCCLGLGEAGELQGKLKKVWRGDKTLQDAREEILDEAGDTLWYLTRLSLELGYSLEELMDRNAQKLRSRKERGTLRGSGDHR